MYRKAHSCGAFSLFVNYWAEFGWRLRSKEKKALKGDKLIDAIRILSLLLEYNVCLQLGIDNQEKVREELSSISDWRAFQEYYQKKDEQI